MNKKTQGKKNRATGLRFERKVREDLESKGWIVSKWMNNVEFTDDLKECLESLPLGGEVPVGKLIPAKHKFRGPGIPMAIGTGFPDFIAYKIGLIPQKVQTQAGNFITKYVYSDEGYDVIFVECKSNGYLKPEEKEKAKWYLENNYCSKFLVASKGEKRGIIKYVEFKNG